MFRRGSSRGQTFTAQDIHEVSTDLKHPLGRRVPIGDRVFHYAQANASAALVAGEIVQSPVPASDHTTLACVTTPAGSNTLVVTNGASTGITANLYDNGYLWADTGTDNYGYLYKIKKHTVALVDVACTFTFFDELVEAMTNAQETISLVRNPYAQVIVQPAVPTAHVLGVPIIDVAVDEYFWLQTWGPASVLSEGSLIIGEHAAVGDGSDGTAQPSDTYIELVVGSVMRALAGGKYSLVYLRLAP